MLPLALARPLSRPRWLRPRWLPGLACAAGLLAGVGAGAADEDDEPSLDDLYAAGKQLFEEHAPPEIREHFEFPDKARWDDFFQRLQAALDGDDFAALAKFEPDIRAALDALRQLPGSEDHVTWLVERLDYAQAAQEIVRRAPVAPVKPALGKAPKPAKPLPGPVRVPEQELWERRVRARPRPPLADQLVPVLQPLFVARTVPRDLVWLAEVESGFNPTARSPAGARGLYQLMPATAQSLGLSTFLPDERTNPRKSADAAARLLRDLRAQFGDWPLALAAYNAGPGRVRRALAERRAKTFAEIAPSLSVETRLYVPKVLATVQVRAGAALPR